MRGAVPEALRAGRRALEGLPGVKMLQDNWTFYEASGGWLLRCRLRVDAPPGSPVPAETDWVVSASPGYPYGPITFWPAREGGLQETFPHQMQNDAVPWLPYRTGGLCLTSNYTAVRTRPDDTEPYHEHGRLRWHCERALGWLRAAAKGELLRPGDPFELPLFARQPGMALLYSEGPEALAAWSGDTARVGLVSLQRVGLTMPTAPNLLYTGRFWTLDRSRAAAEHRWSHQIELTAETSFYAAWVRLPAPPVLSPWRLPRTWGELRGACRERHVRLDPPLLKALREAREQSLELHAPLRGESLPVFLLVGFPVPERVGEEPNRMHWESVLWPRTALPGDDDLLIWMTCANLHPAQVGARGRLGPAVRTKDILMIGAGSLGSALAEMLVRGGVERMFIIDHDAVHVGNLVRHTATLPDLGQNKAVMLAARLGAALPHGTILAIPERFPPRRRADHEHVRRAVVLDVTGDDGVIAHMESFPWGEAERIFLSVSLGRGARRLFCFCARGARFPQQAFRDALEPWLRAEAAEPEDGRGCHDPFFQARSDDVWLMAAAAVKCVAAAIESPPEAPQLRVFEQAGTGEVREVSTAPFQDPAAAASPDAGATG